MSRRNVERFEGKSAAPYNMSMTKGSVHIVAVRGFVEYVVYNKTSIEFLDWVKDTYIPDETFFTSLNHNPHLRVPGSYLGRLMLLLPDLFFFCLKHYVTKKNENQILDEL